MSTSVQRHRRDDNPRYRDERTIVGAIAAPEIRSIREKVISRADRRRASIFRN